MIERYVHGYSETEQQRLCDQSQVLASLLHDDTTYEPGARVLEVGCGVGAQTRIVAYRNPQAHFTCIDVSEPSLKQAALLAERAGLSNVTFEHADVREVRANNGVFDHALFCFVLEHVAEPQEVLRHVSQLVRTGGSITAIEGDHGSTYFYPPSPRAWRTIQCLIDLQAATGGDALIGRRLYPLFKEAGLADIHVTPRAVYADPSRPDWVEGFTKRTYIAMIEGARDRALAADLISADEWELGILDLRRSIQGTFNYTFFKAVGRVV
jgi:ubiquinone/menaquinone biosynthesis C-methylase UbiE